MPRGTEEKIFWPIRFGTIDEEADLAKANEYFAKVASAPENKSCDFMKRQNEKGIELVVIPKKDTAEKQKALSKGYA